MQPIPVFNLSVGCVVGIVLVAVTIFAASFLYLAARVLWG